MRRDYGISINWEEVHAIKHGLHDNPHHILGPHMEWDGVVINAYVQDALKVEVINENNGAVEEMRASGIADFFTLPTAEKKLFPYRLRATYRDGSTFEYVDAYRFDQIVDSAEITNFEQGIDYEMYRVFGSHKRVIDGVEGVLFVVWAPNAQRVSVVGEFNLWEGSRGLMRRLPGSSVFELFIPGITEGTAYKYEIRTYDGETFLKADPCANVNEMSPADASVIYDGSYKFKDGKWMKNRDKNCLKEKAMNVYQVNLSDLQTDDMKENATYRDFAPVLAKYVKDMGYTHIELTPVMDYVNQASTGFETHGFYAVYSKFGTPADLQYFVDYMHGQEIGVLFDWAPGQFGKEQSGLYMFDGAPAYEDSNPLRAYNPLMDNVSFNYGRKEVSNFLISNALYWVEQFHADGLRISSVASMLYLDYGKTAGEWLPNIYGTNENLDAVEFFKHLNSIMKKRNPGVIMIAEDSSLWPQVTESVEEDGLGFDYKWNLGWTDDITDYINTEIGDRREKANELTFSLLYAYNEQYMYGFSDAQVGGEETIYDKIAGNMIQKDATYKVLLGYLMMQPGKKYWCRFPGESSMYQSYKKALNQLYAAEPALYKKDYDDAGFEWINTLCAKNGILVFARKTNVKDDTLVVICNFSSQEHENYKIGVPYPGKYKEIFNSDDSTFAGEGNTNPRMRQTKADECDARTDSMTITIPAFGISVFKYNVAGIAKPVEEEKKETVKKTTVKKTATKKAETVKKSEPVKKAAEVKVEDKKAEPAKKATTKKAEPAKKAATKKAEPAKKAATKKAEPAKKAATKKAEPAKKAATKKAEPAKKATTKKAEPVKKVATKKAEPAKKAATKKAATKKAEPAKKATTVEKVEVKNADTAKKDK